MVKSYLKGADGTLFPLLPKVTTVGRENCDFTIQLPGVDYQHCVIEYSEHDDCFVIQDLNTAQGTYVNDVRVQNAAVRLAPGDHIRFGYNGQPFELQVDSVTQSSIPPVSQRPPVWSQPITLLQEQDIYNGYSTSQYGGPQQGLPHIAYSAAQIQPTATWSHAPTSGPPPLPRPPLRSRPLSAGAARRTGPSVVPVGPPVARTGAAVVGGWVNSPIPRTNSIPDIQLQEKEQRINQLSDELTRLRSVEFDSFRKDTLIQQLQQQNADLQNKVRQEPAVIMGGDMDLSAKLLHLETEVTAKKGEINALREQLSKLQSDRSSSPQLLRQELAERVKEVTQLRTELERVKKDKNITSGLVTQMQRDMSNKDSTISRLTREIEVLKKDIRERDIQMSSSARKTPPKEVPPFLKQYIVKGKESPKAAEENSAREKELVTLRQKFKTAESKVQEQMDTIAGLREELDKTKTQVFTEKDVQRKLQTDLDNTKSQVTDVQRSERVVRVDLEQCQKRIERFRSRVIQVTFSTPGVSVPNKEVSDDDLIEALKKLMEERAKLLSRIKELEGDVVGAQAGKEELLACAEKLRTEMAAALTSVSTGGRLCSVLKQASSVVQSLSTDDQLTWIRDLVVELLDGECGWEQLVEDALETCGVNVKISTDDPGKHIALLYSKWESSLTEKQRLEKLLTDTESANKSELEHKMAAVVSEWEHRLQDAVEKTRLEGEEKLNAAIDEIRAAEGEKRESYVEAERRKINELSASLEQLRQSMTDLQTDHHNKMSEATSVLEQLEEVKRSAQELREELTKQEQLRNEDADKHSAEKQELMGRLDGEVETYKEQIKQHSVTICTMEERLEKLMKKNKDYQEQLSKLRSSKPAPPPKPKVIVQRPREELAALEQVVNALRQENTVLKKEVRDSQDVIMGLRRDLSGASARLSDISGEMSEAQKQEMERNREILTQRGVELTELRQQMAKLSQIIDSQKEEMKSLEGQLSKEKQDSAKHRLGAEENGARLKLLQEELDREKQEQRKQLDLLDQEGRITSELTSMGAQCRGERHQQIISRQREALAELRTKVKTLEQSRPPLPTQDQALQQVVLLKKELAEMRVNQALSEDKVIQSATSLDREIGKARGLITPSNVEADMERSAHRETMDALEASEVSFATLLRAMAASLDLEEIDGLRPMAHIPKDEREALIDAREKACQLLANRIQVLKERIARKDDLLQGYETDLTKLRQSQELADMKSHQVETLANDVRSRAEESQYLRESLNRTRDRLNQEKRLNSAIKQKKTFHLENERSHLSDSTTYKGRHCKVEDPKAEVRKRQQKEIIRRKNYEIKTLRGDLCETEKELYDREKKLSSFQTGLRLERTVEVME
ncbi:forkhead-associated domain-containing protein 1 [Aplysia californica]|uniref:Forkhead-associated domain-containing protein 1 n=1 Tax=Aplysia californica TaxID=6500 RepID=A0ABM1A0T3_APLCA|nr:forkhead-associated domain-containing protein 1 [Aplysia californica]